MNKKIFVLAIVVLVILLSACAAENPAPTATQIEPTALLSTNSQVTYQPTFTITPSLTLRPTSTPYHTSTITPSATPRPTITLPPYPTPELGFSRVPLSISPTGQWIAWEITDKTEYADFQFVDKEGTKIWSYVYDDFPRNVDVPVYTRVDFWSPDNKFVYLITTELDVEWFLGESVYAIAKLSLVNGSLSYIITPNYVYSEDYDIYWPDFYRYDFSDDGQWLVYSILNGQSIDYTLLNLYTSEFQHFSAIIGENDIGGSISLSPNNQFFVFSVAEHFGADEATDEFSVYLVTLDDLSVKQIFHQEEILLEHPEWVSNSGVKYYSTSRNGIGYFILNIETGEITEIDD